jgi:hypothetical protein
LPWLPHHVLVFVTEENAQCAFYFDWREVGGEVITAGEYELLDHEFVIIWAFVLPPLDETGQSIVDLPTVK